MLDHRVILKKKEVSKFSELEHTKMVMCFIMVRSSLTTEKAKSLNIKYTQWGFVRIINNNNFDRSVVTGKSQTLDLGLAVLTSLSLSQYGKASV